VSDRSERIRRHMAVDYPMEVSRDELGYFVRIPDLPGCESSGETITEAMASIEEARELWIETALDSGGAVPAPRGEGDYSGKFVVRVGKSVHRELVRISAAEGVSLNALVTSVLARETGRFSVGTATGCAVSPTPLAQLRRGQG
jgi:antitoxin HicB